MPLKRTLTVSLLTFYGLGTIIGAGIYALIGEVVQNAREFTPVAFLISTFIALFTAASYAELSSRFPMSAGSALYVRKAFNKKWLSGLVGWFIVLTGIVSAATISHGFIKYFQLFFTTPFSLSIIILILLLGAIAIWGIKESATTIMIMTIIEVTGLLLVIYYGKDSFFKMNEINYAPLLHQEIWGGILVGSFIAFYAFIGFEDMVNVAEETQNPERTLPVSIFLALFSAAILYLMISFVTIFSLPYNQLLQSEVPLTLIIQSQGHSPVLFTGIALISIMNGILVQIIMASRLIYGMAKQDNAPAFFENINSKTQTPILSSLLVMIAIIIFALWLPIVTLAKLTSTIMLCVFSMMHLSLIVIKFKHKDKPPFRIPLLFPIIGLMSTVGFLLVQLV